jgi:hypothetical protein
VPKPLTEEHHRRNRVAQWAFDTRPVLGRFHLWLEDVASEWRRGEPRRGFGFAEPSLERALVAATAVTALGTFLFGRYGEGKGLDKSGLNTVKKDADAMSSYVMSESLWFISRALPENHAIMVCLGEGLMPKAGETPEMGANPLLGFGRIYARPQVARFLDKRVARLINDEGYEWEEFYQEVTEAGITIWGAAIDTLENTSRFAKGAPTGPITVIHLFDQPLNIARPFEGYMGNLFVPEAVTETAHEESVLVDFLTPRAKVLAMIEKTYPGIEREHVHVWTLRGKSRETRLGRLWAEWEALGVHIVGDETELPTGHKAFTESGTYAPVYRCGAWTDEAGRPHVFVCDGYAASAEALQAATLAPLFGLDASMVMYTSLFELPHDVERHIMRLDPGADDFAERLRTLFARDLQEAEIEAYRRNVRDAREANFALDRRVMRADDFFPKKHWRCLALSGFMLPDPYSGIDGVRQVASDTYQVSVRASSDGGDALVKMTFRLMEDLDVSRLVFNPLLDRFVAGEDYESRPVKISDSGRIRNELQTLASQALEFFGENGIRVHFDRIHNELMSPDKKERIRLVLDWYKKNHPVWFDWLELR